MSPILKLSPRPRLLVDPIHGAARTILAALLVLSIGLSQVAATEPQAQNERGDPVTFIESLADQAIQILSTSKGSLREREEKFRQILRDDFAMEKIGPFLVGSYWQKMTPDQKETYQELLSEWVLKTYSIRFGGYAGETLRVLKTTTAGKRDVLVHTLIEGSAGEGFDVRWRVRNVNGRFKIIDVYVEGVSMAITQRSEFQSILRRSGVEGLISLLRERLSELSAAS